MVNDIRQFVKYTLLLLTGSLFSLSLSAQPIQEMLVDTPQGRLLGQSSSIDPSIMVSKGIPYAAVPTGDLRWKPAQSPEPWDGIRNATRFGPDCMGAADYANRTYPEEKSFVYHPPSNPSEGCLYLNVWTPEKDAQGTKKPLPVMVWIHSGGFVMGSGSWPLYDGTALTKKGVVLVTFNYRLGIFGHFSHPALTAESSHASSGNYTLTDQIQTLKWVRDNIAAFGGIPEQPYDIFAQGKQHDVPIIAGFNSYESYGGVPEKLADKATYIQDMQKHYGPLAERYLAFYPPGEGQKTIRHYGGMGWWMESAVKAMNTKSSKAYLYYFDQPLPGSPAAFHTADISYVFNNEKYSHHFSRNMPADPPADADLKLAETMSNYWVAFARQVFPLWTVNRVGCLIQKTPSITWHSGMVKRSLRKICSPVPGNSWMQL